MVTRASAGPAPQPSSGSRLRAAKAIREPVTHFELVVLGAPLYTGRWHRDAVRFLRRNRRDLADVPVAVFGMGPRNDTKDAWQRSRAQLGRALAKSGWLAPVSVTVFGGVDPPSRGSRPHRDLRDATVIRAWAGEVLAMAGRAREPGVSRQTTTKGGCHDRHDVRR